MNNEPEITNERLNSDYPMTIHLRGNRETGRVWMNGIELKPSKSQKVWNKSPDGFNWGYAGSGPAQLALAMCIRIFGEDTAMKAFQGFKFEHIAALPQTNFDTYIKVYSPEKYINR